MTTYRSITVAILAALFLSASAGFGATICVNPASALCQPTIQLGINAAGPGDIVRIAAGAYFESVAVQSGKDGLQLAGAGKLTTILDPSPYADIGFAGFHGITVFARRVTIKNLMIRNGNGRGIEVHSPEVVIQGVNINGTNGDAIFVTNLAWNSRIVQSEIHNAGSGISSDAFGTVAQTNVITGTETGIFLQADAGQVLGNKIYSGVTGISAFGDGTVIKNNDIRHQRDLAVFVEGSYPTVQGNKVYGAGVGLQVACIDCFGGSVASNTITDATSYGILASADDFGLVLQSNTLLRTGRGLSLNGIGITARLNKVTDVGLDLFGHCIEAFGDDPTSITDANTIAQNTATRCSQAGIFVSGRETTVDRNVVSDTFENGITVDMSSLVVVSGNKATGNAAQGIAVLSASDTMVTGNTATGNRRDFCNDSGDTTVVGNKFGTSFDTPGVDCTIAHIP